MASLGVIVVGGKVMLGTDAESGVGASSVEAAVVEEAIVRSIINRKKKKKNIAPITRVVGNAKTGRCRRGCCVE